jgi:hypothetical protein
VLSCLNAPPLKVPPNLMVCVPSERGGSNTQTPSATASYGSGLTPKILFFGRLTVKSGVSARFSVFEIAIGFPSTVTTIVLRARNRFICLLLNVRNCCSVEVPVGSRLTVFTTGKKIHVSLDTVHSRVTAFPEVVPARKSTSPPSKVVVPSHCEALSLSYRGFVLRGSSSAHVHHSAPNSPRV